MRRRVRLALTLAGAAESRGADGGSSRRSALTSSGLPQVSEMLPEKTAKSLPMLGICRIALTPYPPGYVSATGSGGPDHIGVKACSGAYANSGRALAAQADGERTDRAWPSEGAAMSEREAFDRILASLHEVALDHAQWSSATALIDDTLRAHGSSMIFGDGHSEEDIQIYFAWSFFRGQRCRELERDYLKTYYPLDERVPRLRHAPDSQLFHTTDLYADEEELRASVTYNELLARAHAQNSIHVRLDGPNGSRIVWGINDPVDGDGWSSAQLDSIRRLLPHIRQTVHVQQALAGAGALGASFAQLLDTTGLGIVQLDGRGRIVAANDRARDLLRSGDGLFDEDGFLCARRPEENAELQGLLARALPQFGGQGAGGSTMVRRSSALPPLVLHVNPVGRQENGLAGLAGRGIRAGCRPGKPYPHRSGRGCGDSRPHGGWRAGWRCCWPRA